MQQASNTIAYHYTHNQAATTTAKFNYNKLSQLRGVNDIEWAISKEWDVQHYLSNRSRAVSRTSTTMDDVVIIRPICNQEAHEWSTHDKATRMRIIGVRIIVLQQPLLA